MGRSLGLLFLAILAVPAALGGALFLTIEDRSAVDRAAEISAANIASSCRRSSSCGGSEALAPRPTAR